MLEGKFKDTTPQVSKETIDWHFALSIEHKDEFFEQLVQMGADVNMNHGQALVMAVKDNDLVRMKLLLEHGADPTLLKDYALKVAVAAENLEALKLIYKYKQNMKGDGEKELDYDEVEKITWCDKDIYYKTFNKEVIQTNNLEIVQYLLPEINCLQYDKLFYALRTKNLERVKLVFDSQEINGNLMQEALFSNSREIIEFMMSHCDGKFPKGTIDTDGAATMCALAADGCCETLKYLIEMSDDARGVVYGESWEWERELKLALKSAVEWRQVEAIKLLSQYAVIKGIDAEYMFQKKGQDDAYSVVKVLIDYQVIKDYEDIAKAAAQSGRTDILELLQSCGISYDYEKTLRSAIIYRHQNTIEYLLKKEEVILTREKVKELLIDVERYEGSYEVIKMLIMKEEESSKKVTSN